MPATDPAPPDYLTPVVFHVLLVLAEGPHYGYAISKEVAELTSGQITMGPGTLYGTLQRLTERGWLVSTDEVDAAGAHSERRRYFELTPAGRSALRTEAERLARSVDLALERAILRTS
ncbi:MAG: PadR family transcriptional regulator [Gemmatimonadota bacterium]|nr:helix-turn-helix transcriptional regulator [Gemmatimonadota bacterium]